MNLTDIRRFCYMPLSTLQRYNINFFFNVRYPNIEYYKLCSINGNKIQLIRYPSKQTSRIWWDNRLRHTSSQKCPDETTFASPQSSIRNLRWRQYCCMYELLSCKQCPKYCLWMISQYNNSVLYGFLISITTVLNVSLCVLTKNCDCERTSVAHWIQHVAGNNQQEKPETG